MKKIAFYIFYCLFLNNNLAQGTFYLNPTGCVGKTEVLTLNSGTANVSFIAWSSIPAGAIFSAPNATSTTVIFPSNGTYSVLMSSGTSTFGTVSYIQSIIIDPQPILIPSYTNATCSSTLNVLDIGLSFDPPASSPSYVVNWWPLPPASVFSPTQTIVFGAVSAGTTISTMSVIVTAGSCSATSVLTISPKPFNPVIEINAPRLLLDCANPSTLLKAVSNPSNVSFSWSSASLSVQGNSLAVFANTINPSQTLLGTYTLTATGMDSYVCTSETVVTIYQNIFLPNPVLQFHTTNTITCSSASVSLTHSSTTGIPLNSGFSSSMAVIGYQWIGPGSQTLVTASDSFVTYIPGTYTFVTLDLNNGCQATSNFVIYDGCNFVGLEKNKLSTFKLVFPNPAYDKLNFNVENLYVGQVEISVENSMSQILYRNTDFFLENGLLLDFLERGFYYLKIQSRLGNSTIKFLKL